MPKGQSPCKYCGKLIPNFFKKHHEENLCLVMRYRRGDFNVPPPQPREPQGLDLFIKEKENDG